ncbi:MAG: class I SAM-dependent methyltransferase [Candidatus Omnitrophota bacterium]|nr:class I SAM-dependent methyltransferase [Candidatus Omnitrophota bacterium]
MLDINSIVGKSIKAAAGEQPWNGYYLMRGLEVGNLLRYAGLNEPGVVLDIGCGNGFASYLISNISKRVVASDLYSKDAKTHTVGLDSARRLVSKMSAANISISACSIECLPFKNETFDIIFSSYVMHYLKSKAQALSELKRVVKKEGMVILVVPNFMERIYAFFQFYLYFAVKFFGLVKERIFRRNNACHDVGKITVQSFSKLKENYKYFPFPGPHGAYRNSFIEMISHTPCRWNREFQNAGFIIQRSFTTVFAPYPLLLTVSLKLTVVISKIFEPLARFLGDKRFIKYLGYNYCAILKK